jgi:signal transduction histidine kinase
MIKKFLTGWASSLNPDEDRKRREVILNIVLMVSIAAFIILNLIRFVDLLMYPEIEGLPIWTTLIILGLFCFFFWLSKKGRAKTAAWLALIIYSLPMFYCFIIWGTDLPAALLLAVLIISLAGILISENLVLITTGFISLSLIVITIGQERGLIPVQSYWRDYPTTLGDIISYAILLFIAAVVTWLFVRGINRALRRAQQSEADLKQERDSLEIRVIERTAELRQVEAEKINQLYRLAEFGRLSSGIFHDLVNPLTAVSLNLEQIKDETGGRINSAKSYLGQALIATKKMEDLVASIKKQLRRESKLSTFSVNEEIKQIIQILTYKARKAGVEICCDTPTEICLPGDAIKFSQIIMNLLANAIEACEDGVGKGIRVCTSREGQEIVITVSDDGPGIISENIDKIFQPFFSTKNTSDRGLGLGLASTKSIVEKDFGGCVKVDSQLGQGAKFTVSLPGPII